MSSRRVLIYVLRRDLRVADNPIFHEISKLCQEPNPKFTHVLPVYVFPANQIEISGFLASSHERSPFPEARSQVGGFWRCGLHRAKFLAESVWEAKTDLEKLGSGLIIRVGTIGQVLKDLLYAFKHDKNTGLIDVWMTSEEAVEEKREEKEAGTVTELEGGEFRLWADEKYFIDDRDLPFSNSKDLPDVFTTFRKQVEPLRDGPRPVRPVPEKLPPLPPSIPDQSSPFTIPDSLESLIAALHSPLKKNPLLDKVIEYPEPTKSAHNFQGGSGAAHARVHHLLLNDHASSYKDTRNGLLGQDFSTKLSAWLSLGCITARQVHQAILKFEDGTDPKYTDLPGYGSGENAGTAAIRFELLWRDYMRLCTRKFGSRLFRISGFRKDDSYPWRSPSNPRESSREEVAKILARFLRGETGTSLIDASQRELFHTGYTSNRARQNVASFLSKYLQLDWRLGAEWYEALLIDYDVCSNWGNWQYVAGVGNDPRGDARVFNPVKQGFDYDPKGEYVKAWIPELRDIEDVMVVFQPFLMVQEEKERKGFVARGNEDNEVALEWLNQPLVRIDFKLGGKRGPRKARAAASYGGGGRHHRPRGPGRYGGSSRNNVGAGQADTAEAGEYRGRGRGGRGGRHWRSKDGLGGGRGRARSDRERGKGMDTARQKDD